MAESPPKTDGDLSVVESCDRWIEGKTEQELIGDLRTHLALLRDNPRSIPDRLRVAAIQLRLGRIDEALIHYEGVVGGYVAVGQVMSAITLCERLLRAYPDLKRIGRLLAALYARAPRGARPTPGPVEPIAPPPINKVPSTTFALSDLDILGTPARSEDGSDRFVVVDRLFPDAGPVEPPQPPPSRPDAGGPAASGAGDGAAAEPEERTTEKFQREELLAGSAGPADLPEEPDTGQDLDDPDTEEEVVLLTKRKNTTS